MKFDMTQANPKSFGMTQKHVDIVSYVFSNYVAMSYETIRRDFICLSSDDLKNRFDLTRTLTGAHLWPPLAAARDRDELQRAVLMVDDLREHAVRRLLDTQTLYADEPLDGMANLMVLLGKKVEEDIIGGALLNDFRWGVHYAVGILCNADSGNVALGSVRSGIQTAMQMRGIDPSMPADAAQPFSSLPHETMKSVFGTFAQYISKTLPLSKALLGETALATKTVVQDIAGARDWFTRANEAGEISQNDSLLQAVEMMDKNVSAIVDDYPFYQPDPNNPKSLIPTPVTPSLPWRGIASIVAQQGLALVASFTPGDALTHEQQQVVTAVHGLYSRYAKEPRLHAADAALRILVPMDEPTPAPRRKISAGPAP